jgi:filamentous hemagglutinin
LTYPTTDGSAGQVIKTDGSGNLSFTTISTNSISQLNSNVTVTDSGTGAITIAADGSTIITMNATTVLDASAVTNAIRLPNGTTAQRPSGAVGEIRYNSSTDTIEGYTSAGGWAQLGATTATAENTDDTSTGGGTAISTTQGVIDQFVTSSFDSAWYLTVTRDEINDEVSTAKHSLVHNDTSAFVATSHITESDPTNAYLTAQADVAGGNARLLGTGGSVVNSVSTYRIALGDNTSAGTTGNVVTSINTDVDSASEVVDSWAHASYRGAKYYISVNNASKTEVSNMEALVVHDGTTAFITTYGLVNTGSNDLLSLTAAINGANVELSAAGNEPNLRVTMYKILLADDESAATGDSVNVIEATTVSSAATTIDSFATTAYTGAFYVFTGHNATEGASSISEVIVVANDEAYITTGPMVSSKGTDQLTFSASLSGQTVTVQAASTSGSSTTVNGYRVHMLRGSAGASTADTVLVSTEQTITGAKTFDSPIALTVGSDPSTVADKAHIYAKDEASSAEVFVRDEAGNVTKISPHNEQGEWEYYSKNIKTGKTVRINMEEMIRDIEKLTGKSYIKND